MNYFLIEYPNLPIALSLEDVFIIGRDEDNELQVNSSFASRKHTSIFHKDGHFYVQDLGSTNGTFLNAKKIERAELKHGDQIGVGDRIYIFYGEEPSSISIEGGERKSTLISEKISVSRRGQLSGTFEEFNFLELLQYLSTRHRTGSLMVKAKDESDGVIEFREGHIEHSFYQGLKGETAVKKLREIDLRDFQFDPKHKTDIVSIDKSTSRLLIEMLDQYRVS